MKYILFLIFIGFFYNGQLANASQLTDTLENYIQLKVYSGIEDSIYINHKRYYGLFVKENCDTEDFGTIILSASGCWKRIFTNYSPRFWAIGGQSPDNLIGRVKEEIDAINSAAITAFNHGGGTIEIDSMFPIDRSVFLLPNNTYLGVSDSSGFFRVDAPRTILRDTAKVGDDKIIIENNAGFRTYHKINIVNSHEFDSIAGHVSYTASVAPVLGEDTTIWLSGLDIQKQMLPGDTVSLFYPMMTPRFSNTDSIHLENLVFDGRRNQYNLNYDWRVNPTIKLPTSKGVLIEQCRFYNVSNENIFLCGAIVKDCSGINLNGSAIHFSCSGFDNPTEILYNNFSKINEVGDSIMQHSEAGFTFSAKVQNFRIAYNVINEIGEYGIGVFQNDDSQNEITDNLLDTQNETVAFSSFYLYPETNIIYNNKNPNFANTSTEECFISKPKPKEALICQAASSFEEPLILGDTLTVVIDSLFLINSNENFLKCISPVYDNTYFELIDVQLSTPGISEYHQWEFNNTATLCQGALFDNGHKNGKLGKGNWGYEGCGQSGKCKDITFSFIVSKLPDMTAVVGCPLTGLEIYYDGELETWDAPVFCEKKTIQFDPDSLGYPVLSSNPMTKTIGRRAIEGVFVFPNPVETQLKISAGTNFANLDCIIFDVHGKSVLKTKIENNAVNVEGIPSGIYWLQIPIAGEYIYERVIKIQ